MKKLSKMLIIIAAVVVVLGLGATVGYLMLTRDSATNANQKTGPLFETDEFTVNAANSYSHYIKAQFALEMSSDKVKKELDEKKPILRDAIIKVLSTQPFEILNTQKGKEDLKEALIREINSFLSKGQITGVYIESIIFS